ncbi:MAG: hypothetical protein K9W46_06480 [Candidatus Heimdallarchaeum endolithica]|uniref:Uncharacterized protein n=1 Tax=Candidatus Heimdallarchaeum endolithica TaxID=2876572 RepID=A0A9Y1BTS8_9ARCH|nr:MAG: hypothetical protein K9W46_06480 [Candidatus Heimdallarchaeum endolithica]
MNSLGFQDIIKPLVAVFTYNIEIGKSEIKVENVRTNRELEEIERNFNRLSYDFLEWVKRYNEITIFKGSFRATYIKFYNMLLLFVSRLVNSGFEIRPVIKKFLNEFVNRLVDDYISKNLSKSKIRSFLEIEKLDKENLKSEIVKTFTRMKIDPSPLLEKLSKEKREEGIQEIYIQDQKKRREDILSEYQKSEQFELVPSVKNIHMTAEIIESANKKAITSLLFTVIKGCKSPSAAAYIYPMKGGAIGELYAGDLEEHKIIYVLEVISEHQKAINEMLHSKEDLKMLDAGIIQIILEDLTDGKIIIGITTNKDDVYNVGYKIKIARFIIKQFGF